MNDARREMFDALNSFSEFEAVKVLGPIKVGKIEITVEDFDAFTPFDKAHKEAFDLAIKREARVPNYPFKDDWYAMSIKQLLKDAIDEGSDAISVSTSAPIVARYSDQYKKFYETLYDQKIPSAMKKLANKYGGKFEKGSLDKTDTFGDVSKTPQGEPYNQAQLDTINKAIAADQPNLKTNIIRITPEMKAKILEEGLPSFAFGGPVFKPFSIDNIDIFNP